MVVEAATGARGRATRNRPVPDRRGSRVSRVMYVLLRVLTVLMLAQVVFAGLFLDGYGAWRAWHAMNGMVLIPLLGLVQVVLAVLLWRPGRGPGWMPLASVGLLATMVAQSALGTNGVVSLHFPLGMALMGFTGALLTRARSLARPTATPAATADPAPSS